MTALLWYVSYGSNMSWDRFGCYLEGGTPPGGRRRNPGARDATAPRDDAGVMLPGTTYFSGESPQWGGGVAFYDHETSGQTAARAYLITAQQLADVAAQEMHLLPGDDTVVAVTASPLENGRHSFGDGHYETLVHVGDHDGRPMLTLTAPHTVFDVDHTAPSPAYLATMAAGIREGHAWSEERVETYLADLQPETVSRPRA